MDKVGAKCRGAEQVSLSEILDAVGRRSYGPLLVLIGLFAISPLTLVPGMTFLTAGLAFIVAGQMALGMKRSWLPRQVRERRISARTLTGFLHKAEPWARRIDRFLKPRLEFLAAPPFVNVVALFCLAAAIITIPLGFVPLLPFFPSLAILLFGLGITARDGLLLALGMAVSAGAFALALPLLT